MFWRGGAGDERYIDRCSRRCLVGRPVRLLASFLPSPLPGSLLQSSLLPLCRCSGGIKGQQVSWERPAALLTGKTKSGPGASPGSVGRAPLGHHCPEETLHVSLLSRSPQLPCSCLPETQKFSFVFNSVSPHIIPPNATSI